MSLQLYTLAREAELCNVASLDYNLKIPFFSKMIQLQGEPCLLSNWTSFRLTILYSLVYCVATLSSQCCVEDLWSLLHQLKDLLCQLSWIHMLLTPHTLALFVSKMIVSKQLSASNKMHSLETHHSIWETCLLREWRPKLLIVICYTCFEIFWIGRLLNN